MTDPKRNGLDGLRRYYGEEGLERLLAAPGEVAKLKAEIKMLRFRWRLAAAVATAGLASWGAYFAGRALGP